MQKMLSKHPEQSRSCPFHRRPVTGLAPLNYADGVGSPAIGFVQLPRLRHAEIDPCLYPVGIIVGARRGWGILHTGTPFGGDQVSAAGLRRIYGRCHTGRCGQQYRH